MAKKVQKGKKKFNLFTKGSVDYIIWITVMILVAFGLIMVLSASSPSALSETGDSYKYIKKQAISAVIGLVAMMACSKVDYHIFRKLKWIIYVVFIVLLVLVGFVGIDAGGARRWINIAGFNFQPSEFAKIGFILFFASILSDVKEHGKIKEYKYGFIYPLIFMVPIVGAILILQNHFSATFIIAVVTIVQMFVAGTKISHFLITGLVGGVCGAGALMIKNGGSTLGTDFRSSRIQTWLDPFSDPTGDGWQIIQSLYAIGSGGLFGVGLGNSRQKYLYLPEPHNDFIFSVLAEELGFVGCVAVILLFTLFVWRGVVISMKAKDNFGCLIAIGIVTMLGLQAMINIAVVTGTIPVTGMPLPFFSYGGTSLIANLIAVGILLNISRTAK